MIQKQTKAKRTGNSPQKKSTLASSANFCYVFFWTLRIYIKFFKRDVLHFSTDSFCRRCGIDVRDFSVTNAIWDKVRPYIKYGNTLCYNCFSDIWYQIGYNNIWELKKMK